MQAKDIAVLAQSPLFAGIPSTELEDLLACLHAEPKHFAAGEIIALAGEPAARVGILLYGEITVVRENAMGGRSILSVLEPADIFGEMGVFSPAGTWPATVTAQKEAAVMFLAAASFTGVCGRNCGGHRRLTGNMLRLLAQKALLLQRKLEYLSMGSLRAKIGAYLLEQHARAKNTRFMLPLDRDDLADFLGAARPSLSRELCRMRDEGIIEFHRRLVVIKDLEALRRGV